MQKITLRIAGRVIAMDIEPQHEEVYRLAERKINDLVTKAEQQRYSGFIADDFLAIAALSIAIEGINAQRRRTIQSEELQTLIDLEALIDKHLNTPGAE